MEHKLEPDWEMVAHRIREVTGGKDLIPSEIRALSSGSINKTAVFLCGPLKFFVKHNEPELLEMFIAEAEGLQTIERAAVIRVPHPVCWGRTDHMSFLALEYVEMTSLNSSSQEQLGRCLASLHHVAQPRYGWDRNNTIGLTPQNNSETDIWFEFFRDQRLRFQLELAAQKGFSRLRNKGERLLADLGMFFVDHDCVPSLLHGDLWYGNTGTGSQDEPVIFDPALYFGDREADIAMTELFGGFSTSFYGAYKEAWPLQEGYELRRTIYNLYHVLNHLNLFGGAYARQAEEMIDRVLAAGK